MRLDMLSIFPGMFAPVFGEGMLRIAQEKGLASFHAHDIRQWSDDEKHRKVDDRPFGGGPGMVMKAEPVCRAVEAVRRMTPEKGRLILTAPSGQRFDQALANELATEERLIILCGRYEGMDERAVEALSPEEISIGDYVLTGGELAAMVIADAVVRLLPGVLGDPASLEDESFQMGLLDYPQYTQPAQWRGRAVPEILRSGHHGAIRDWRMAQAERRTRARRPDLLDSGTARADV